MCYNYTFTAAKEFSEVFDKAKEIMKLKLTGEHYVGFVIMFILKMC